MNMNSINFTVAKKAMAVIAAQGKQGHLSLVGLSQADFDLLTGSAPWLPTDRNRMYTALNALMNVSVDLVGCPRFKLPAEWVAAAICVFIDPINAQSICRIVERSPSAHDLGIGVDGIEPCTAEQLFALYVQLNSDNAANQARATFESKTSLALSKTLAVA